MAYGSSILGGWQQRRGSRSQEPHQQRQQSGQEGLKPAERIDERESGNAGCIGVTSKESGKSKMYLLFIN